MWGRARWGREAASRGGFGGRCLGVAWSGGKDGAAPAGSGPTDYRRTARILSGGKVGKVLEMLTRAARLRVRCDLWVHGR
jgi:hypothetical protein